MAEMAKRMGEILKDDRFTEYWKFVLDRKSKVYIQRLLDASVTLRGYQLEDILNGKYGEPGAALALFRTYPRLPFYEQIHEDQPFFTDTGRLNAYCDIQAITGGNFIVHQEGGGHHVSAERHRGSNPYIQPEIPSRPSFS